MTAAGRRALIPPTDDTPLGSSPANVIGSVEAEGRGVLVPVRGGMFGSGGVPMYAARRLRRSGVIGVPKGESLRPPGVPVMGVGEKRGLPMLTGLLGLDMIVEVEK
jgi:hypothetical protein